MLFLGLSEDEIGEDERRHHGEEGLSNSPQSIWQSFKDVILWNDKSGKELTLPCEKAPAKAFCSRGEIWYLVVPLMVTPRAPNPSPLLTTEVLMISQGSEN